jgi:hypothetical protein
VRRAARVVGSWNVEAARPGIDRHAPGPRLGAIGFGQAELLDDRQRGSVDDADRAVGHIGDIGPMVFGIDGQAVGKFAHRHGGRDLHGSCVDDTHLTAAQVTWLKGPTVS